MKKIARCLSWAALCALLLAALFHGPVGQLPHYHDFADQTPVLGIPHARDVVSNLGFALVALWGWARLRGGERFRALGGGAPGYRLFLAALLLTACGSTWYHLAPDNARLIWDRLPIALACAGLLAGVWGETHAASGRSGAWLSALLAVFAVFSVFWWYATELRGQGDLRCYLLLQIAPFVLVPMWQWLRGRPVAERRAFGIALLLYAVAKAAELYDHEIGRLLGGLTGHTLKHLLATAAAGVIVADLVRRSRQPARQK